MENQVVILTFLTDTIRLVRYLGPYQIAWFVRQHGYTTQVLDYIYFMSKEQRMNLYKKFISEETKIIGFAPFLMPGTDSIIGQKLDNGLDVVVDIINEIQENFPWAKVIIGGQSARWYVDSGYKSIPSKFDAIFTGEGEHAFLEYCDHIFKKGPHPSFNLFNSTKVIKASKQYDISTCGMRFEKRDFVLPGESLPVEFSRGCIFKCKFCQYPLLGKDKDDFNRSIENIRQSFLHHYELFGTTRYHICDDTLNAHRERTKAFHQMVQELPFKIEYVGFVRLDLIDIWPEQKDILPESGLVAPHFGIESLDPHSCKQIGKGWGAKNHKPFLKKLNEYWGDDVIINCSLIAGLGHETVKDWEETYAWFENSGIHDWFYAPLHLSYTSKLSEFERNAEQYGYKWPAPDKWPFYWTSPVTNTQEAANWCKTKRTIPHYKKRIPSAWNYASYRNQGFSKEEILKGNYVDLNIIRQDELRSQKLVEEYYKIAMSYQGE